VHCKAVVPRSGFHLPSEAIAAAQAMAASMQHPKITDAGGRLKDAKDMASRVSPLILDPSSFIVVPGVLATITIEKIVLAILRRVHKRGKPGQEKAEASKQEAGGHWLTLRCDMSQPHPDGTPQECPTSSTP
jgi:hypothetical protein